MKCVDGEEYAVPLYREEPPEIESGSTETGCRSSLPSRPLNPYGEIRGK
ncbi:hypothetical protein [Paenibacillus foliorum]|nr:hypothetical protein [Paenibacillus foliorum]